VPRPPGIDPLLIGHDLDPRRARCRHLGHLASNVVVAGGRVFYVRQPGTELEITALRASDGAVLWSRTWMEETWGLNGLAVDGGRLFFVRNHSASSPEDVHVEAIDPATGPLRQSDGADRWPAKSLSSGNSGTPSLDGSNVYVSLAGARTYAFDRGTGVERWHYGGRP
jgi:outer membrane protein assembly factor BamB